MKPNLTNLKPSLNTPNNQTQIKNVQEEIANLSPQILEPEDGGFLESIKSAIDNVSDTHKKKCRVNKEL